MDPMDSTVTSIITSKPIKAMNVTELSSSLQHFGVLDYFVFVLMLSVCAIIGLYFGFIENKKKQSDNEQRRGSEALEYLVGGRKMKVFPVALSLVASFVSGISLLGTSTEIYVYGTQYAFILITLVISGIISWYVFLPVFCNLQLTSTYEYFEMRFGREVRYFGSVLFIVNMILWLPVAVYVPALTFNQVSGIDTHIVTPIVCLICTFYTCVGGLKAVIWTDVVQSFIMYGSIVTICIKGTLDVGGLDVVLQRNRESGRLNMPDWTWDPTVRLSMLAVFVGGSLHKIQSSAVNQICIQRYLSLPSLQKAKHTVVLFNILLIFLMLCCCYMGLLAYASYYDCDPISTKLAAASDQLPTLHVMKTYIGKRFSRRMQLFSATLFVIKAIIWLPIAIYVPALTFSQISGIGVHTITPVVIAICTFYTTVGGIKCVVWTDVIQSLVMYSSLIALIIKGTYDVGGITIMWQRNQEGGRLNTPEITLDPTVRMSIISVIIGGTFFKLQNTSINQPTIQRFMSLSSLKAVKYTLFIFTFGVIFLYLGCIYVGLVAFATYYKCDPISTGVSKLTYNKIS
ncbi:sodium-coupled monocarboxylate transporter 1 isoform X2 [Bactrocera neohumeralis]|uniref:sodium-coupled monocarboxylate transporter 1 isoform X2 n=1 Tax=Bactrocera neohumeralis TaxID=98809 RepID=UPI002165DEE1|nr:sodium-coupled monocarboxylate transporter 1 isoform X2 [Bactrocera neohumeralis]